MKLCKECKTPIILAEDLLNSYSNCFYCRKTSKPLIHLELFESAGIMTNKNHIIVEERNSARIFVVNFKEKKIIINLFNYCGDRYEHTFDEIYTENVLLDLNTDVYITKLPGGYIYKEYHYEERVVMFNPTSSMGNFGIFIPNEAIERYIKNI